MIYFGPCGLEHPAAQGLQRVDGKRQDHQAREYRPQMPFPVAEGAAEMYARPAFRSLEAMVFDMPATATNATDGQGGPPSLKAVARQRQATHERPSRDLGMTLRIFFPGGRSSVHTMFHRDVDCSWTSRTRRAYSTTRSRSRPEVEASLKQSLR